MLRFLPAVVELALLVYCLVDCIQTERSRVRTLPKLGWILLIIILPIIGGVGWLLAGRPRRDGTGDHGAFGSAIRGLGGGPDSSAPRRPLAPEDDPNFMRRLDHGNPEKERLLEEWEAERARREAQEPVAPKDAEDAPGETPGSQERPTDAPG